MPKIPSASHTLKQIQRCKKAGKTIVFTNGCFDLIHSGHVQYLHKAKKYGDVLVVGLNADLSVRKLKGKERPILNLKERYEILSALKDVNYVIPFSASTPRNLILKVKPHVLVKGGDWKLNDIVGAKEVMQSGGKVVSSIYVKGRSTTQILKSILQKHR